MYIFSNVEITAILSNFLGKKICKNFFQMKIILTGYPGSGKSTIANCLAKEFGLLHISTGELCRKQIEAQTERGKRIEKLVKQGQYVSPDEWFPLVLNELDMSKKTNGWVIEGAPRSKEQAQLFKKFGKTTPHFFIHLDVPKEQCIERITCRSQIEQRADDSANALETRFELHDMHHKDLHKWFPNAVYRKVDASKQLDQVYKTVSDLLREK